MARLYWWLDRNGWYWTWDGVDLLVMLRNADESVVIDLKR